MLIQDSLTGRLHEIPDQLYGSYLGEYGRLYEPQWGEYPQGYGYSRQYGAGQVVYDGLGNPVGIFPLLAKLAPLAAKLLPAIATKVLPAITKFLPAITKALPVITSVIPGAKPAQSPAAMMQPQPPTAMPPASGLQFAPSPVTPFLASMPAPEQAPVPPVMATPGPMPIQAPIPPVMAMPAPMPIQAPAPPVMAMPATAPITPLQPMAVPYPSMMAMIAPRVMRSRRRRGRRPIIRRIAVPLPPGVMEPVRDVRIAEPSGAVQGWGCHGGFNGYGWR
jgi:hypothetical protein